MTGPAEPAEPDVQRPTAPQPEVPQPGAMQPEMPQPASTPDAGSPAPEPAGWRPPGPDDGVRRGGCLVALVVAVAGLFGLVPLILVGLIFLGGQIEAVLAGSIEFGTGGTGCAVSGRAETFGASDGIHYAAHLSRQVSAGETITAVVTLPDGSRQRNDVPADLAGRCIYEDIPAGLPAGSYALEFSSSGEVLAEGGFEVTP